MEAFLVGVSLVIVLGQVGDSLLAIYTGIPTELNPMARWVLERWGLKALIGCKMAGSVLALVVVWSLYLVAPMMAALVGGSLAAGMISLAIYLWWYS